MLIDLLASDNDLRSPRTQACGNTIQARMRSRQQDERLRNIVGEHLDTVARVLRNAGVSESQLDDELQRTLITVARRLDDIRPGAEKSFLIQIALRVAAHARRTVARRREVTADELDADGLSVVDAVGSTERRPSPEHLTNQKRMRDALDRILESLEDDLREVFVLYEFEEMSMIEISGVLGIPQGTVASRLRRARATFRERVVELGLVEGAPVPKLVGS
ncbi:MAG: sigma-70 family RNA polymerase sigma factor [Anaeromyxobacter sp.]